MSSYLHSAIKLFLYYQDLGNKTFAQLDDAQLFWQANAESNSIALIVQHISGNMLSRWTDFLTSDGEKPWRNRDAEFELSIKNKLELIEIWNKGWQCLFTALDHIKETDMERTVYIRNQGHTVVEAINRQLAHYSYHIGQIVFIAKILLDDHWQTLSIARGNSTSYNNDKFNQEKSVQHFTDEFLKK